MVWIDIVLGILLLLGAFRGFMNGFFIELASILALVLGVYVAIHFSDYAAGWIAQQVEWDEGVVNLVAFAVTFLAVLLGVSLIAKLITKAVNMAALGIFNKLLGAGFGLLKLGFLASVLLMFVNSLSGEFSLISQDTKDNSILYPYIEPLAPYLVPVILSEAEKYDIGIDGGDDEIE